jgi:neprilysin
MNNIFHILKWDAQRNLNLLRKNVDKGKRSIVSDYEDLRALITHFRLKFVGNLKSKHFSLFRFADKWSTEPAVVNAFYNPNKNDIGKG